MAEEGELKKRIIELELNSKLYMIIEDDIPPIALINSEKVNTVIDEAKAEFVAMLPFTWRIDMFGPDERLEMEIQFQLIKLVDFCKKWFGDTT